MQRFYKGRRVWMIYGTMRDKAVEEVTGLLFPLAHKVILTAPESARALRPQSLLDHFPDAIAADSLEAAIAMANREAGPNDTILITGSLFVVGEARRLLMPS